ncbi:hypothetical protein BDM02DRAFT_3107251 [Thelephora ganbajun]|uniref:Uncharacterized protein n=1 Tax=Thelephora ganbajun TaxID=370292 RepID=A0ACB6ZWR4_THEGA|nr:hypothetical protein BDM02DRAFT_3107251 [Thelephora ganbajun]
MSQSTPYQRTTEQIRSAREDLIQGNSDDYFPTVETDRQDADSSSSFALSDIPEGVIYPKQSSDELGSLGDSPASVYTPRPYDHLAKPMVREESVDTHALLRPPSGLQTSTTPDGHPKPILKQTLTSLLAEKRSSLHDILSTSPDPESRKPRRVSFADENEFSPFVMYTESEDSAPSVSEFEDSTTTEQLLRGITRMFYFELERRLKTSTPMPNGSSNALPRSSSSISVTEPDPLVDFVRVVPWNDQGHSFGRGSGSWKQIRAQVFSWCHRHGDDSCDGGPKQMVELRALPTELQHLILEFERSRIEQTQGHGKRKHRIVHVDVSRVLNSS